MTDVLPRLDGAFDEIDRRTIDRRQLLRAGAWAAPVIVLATAAPAAATSVDPASAGTGNVPASALFVDAYSVSDLNGNGTHGPLSWAGGQVGYWNAVQGIAVATFLWTAVLTKPGGTTLTIASGSGNVPVGQALVIPAQDVAQKPIAAGKYTLTLTIYGSQSSTKSDVETISIS